MLPYPIPTAGLLPSGGTATVTWANGKSTTVNLKVCTPEGCSTVDKSPDGANTCPTTSPTEFEAKGKVTKDTTGSATVGSGAKAEACVDGTANVSLEPGTTAQI